ncbi:MAG: hypothetical protein U9Q03_05425 [Patescibacteria group bacterium]|nr:hypothetical protein [Patescibacteria group bacterium]
MITVIMLSALILVVGISAAFIGQTDIIIAGQVDRGHYARLLAITCTEEALQRLKLDASYTGGTIPIASMTCVATVTGSGASRTITGSATHDNHTKTVSVSATRRDNGAGNARAWNIGGWQEVDP